MAPLMHQHAPRNSHYENEAGHVPETFTYRRRGEANLRIVLSVNSSFTVVFLPLAFQNVTNKALEEVQHDTSPEKKKSPNKEIK